MAVTLRSVKGSNLTPAEVDANFSGLDTRVGNLETNPPTPISVSNVTSNGSTFTVYLSNGSSFGPFDLPYATIRWAGQWTAGESYSVLDLFYAVGYGLYLVLGDYEAPTEFDPDVENTDGALLRQLMGPTIPVNVLSYTDDHTLTASDLGGYVGMNKATGVLFSIPLNSVVPVDIGSVVTLRQVGLGQIAIDPLDTSIVINSPETLLSRKKGSTLTLIKVAEDEWDLSGDLELE